ncbi:MAG: ribonuclease III [Bacilli bacterium]|nr:ribonuclease III [Bacilli bacterium]MDY6430289.1 ribonuclease III [Bacilli bacterium]
MEEGLRELITNLGLEIHDENVYERALTHSSCNGVNNTKHQDYERLEFLGDSIVGMVVTELCYLYHEDLGQGTLTMLKSKLICTQTEANYAVKLGLDKYVKVGQSFVKNEASLLPLYEDVFEAFIGAIFLDNGLIAAHDVVYKIYEEAVKEYRYEDVKSPKNILQEYVQADSKDALTYRILKEYGSGEDKRFVAGVYINGTELGRGEGRSKKIAETHAAEVALSKLSIDIRK